MTIAFSQTAGQIITQALIELRILASGEVATAAEHSDALVRLNMMLKSWAARGVLPWQAVEATVVFPADTAEMALTPRPIDVAEARYRDAASGDRMLQKWGSSDYLVLPDKAARGAPAIFSLRQTAAGTYMRLWPVPAAAATIAYSYGRVIEDVADINSAVDVPQQWLEAITLNLAVLLAPMYGAQIHPVTIERARQLQRDLEDAGRPDSYMIVPWDY